MLDSVCGVVLSVENGPLHVERVTKDDFAKWAGLEPQKFKSKLIS